MRAIVDEAHHLGLPVTAHAHGTPAIVDTLAAGIDGLEHATVWTERASRAPRTSSPRSGRDTSPIGRGPPASRPHPTAPLDEDTSARIRGIVAERVGHAAHGRHDSPGHRCRRPPVETTRRRALRRRAAGCARDDGRRGALRAATSAGAVVCGLGDCKGRIAEGYDADVLAIDGDPLTEPSALHAIRAVFLPRGTHALNTTIVRAPGRPSPTRDRP